MGSPAAAMLEGIREFHKFSAFDSNNIIKGWLEREALCCNKHKWKHLFNEAWEAGGLPHQLTKSLQLWTESWGCLGFNVCTGAELLRIISQFHLPLRLHFVIRADFTFESVALSNFRKKKRWQQTKGFKQAVDDLKALPERRPGCHADCEEAAAGEEEEAQRRFLLWRTEEKQDKGERFPLVDTARTL